MHAVAQQGDQRRGEQVVDDHAVFVQLDADRHPAADVPDPDPDAEGDLLTLVFELDTVNTFENTGIIRTTP